MTAFLDEEVAHETYPDIWVATARHAIDVVVENAGRKPPPRMIIGERAEPPKLLREESVRSGIRRES
jgi:hypothetical protein